ncbi:CAP domain-containing protein [Acidimicrobiia bacterium EGI L10123]|uniref:CAP domain-containing protein n=1 Tax=Salinilacustrithrix flava TaxID=2957203 RepID=UPI003D7C204B|nr:CAP domain-containing protein [Acidimicrobiia bacterium EGI L10123]
MSISTRAPRLAPPAPTDDSRRRRRPKRLALALAAPLLVLGLAACDPTPPQESVRAHVNESRRAAGVHAVGDDLVVRLKAQAWADRLAANGSLSHSTLSSGLDGVPWVAVAENVGRGSSIRSVHDGYMGSSRHRANILDRRWDRMGAGHAVAADGTVYTVQVFVDLG